MARMTGRSPLCVRQFERVGDFVAPRSPNTIDGCQAEYVRVPDAMANLGPVPDALTDEQVLMCRRGCRGSAPRGVPEPVPDEAIAAIRTHAGQLSLAAGALGCSHSSLLHMAGRYPRVAKAVKDAENRLTEIAVVQMHKLVLQGDYRACAFWLSSRMGQAKGFAPPANAPVSTGEPTPHLIIGSVNIVSVPSGSRYDEQDRMINSAGTVLEGTLIEHDARTEEDL